MKLTAQQLRYVMKAAEKGSLTEAAKDLRVSQATLSIAITQVEDHIGFKVFHRGRKGATPTSRGIEFLGYARRAVQSMDLIETKFGNEADANLDFVVVGQNFGFAQWALGDLARLPPVLRLLLFVRHRANKRCHSHGFLGVGRYGAYKHAKRN